MWKYKIVIADKIDEQELNEIGKDGWELIQIARHEFRGDELIFKKFLTEEEYILDKLLGES